MQLEELPIFLSLESFYVFVLLYSLLLAYLVSPLLARRFETPHWQMRLFVVLLNIALPLVGVFVTLWLVYYLLRVTYKEELGHVHTINMVEFETRFPEVKRTFGEGSIVHLLLDHSAKGSLRMQALSALEHNPSREDLKLIKQGLSDKNDEIRLFSFSVLDKKEKHLSEAIHQQKKRFEHAVTQAKRCEAAEALVYLFWDMLYYEFVDVNLKQFIVEEIERYAAIVLRFNPHHTRVNLTLGKMYLKVGDYDQAQHYLEAAVASGKETDFMIPYLAQIAFEQRDFGKVKALLQGTEKLRFDLNLYPLIAQWNAL